VLINKTQPKNKIMETNKNQATPHATATAAPTLASSLFHEAYDMGDFVLKQRRLGRLAKGRAVFPIYRELRLSACGEIEVLFDKLALVGDWQAERIDEQHVVLETASGDVLISLEARRKQDYSSYWAYIWASGVDAAEAAKARILELVGTDRITEPMFAVDWFFLTGRGNLESVAIEEKLDAPLNDLAYPEIHDGVTAFVQRFLDADESVLVLQGPPGTGKSRLIRAILGEMSRRKGEHARALYTGDKRTMENDEIFVRFITGWEDAFVIEDADHLLKPRCDGNEHVHRFLTIADGVVRSQGRKIIFSTNLPNVGDLDDALVRPGRCFARLYVRELMEAEAVAFVYDVLKDTARTRIVTSSLFTNGEKKTRSLAEIYKAMKTTPAIAPQPLAVAA
jgi:ATPase family associated with various cellular activities (AAA)